jgi:hypothetical protein
MKKILIALIFGLVFLPVTATAQKWIEPHVRDGTQVEGHWESSNEAWRRQFDKPGTVNPLTGQVNTFGRRNYLTSPQVTPSTAPNSYTIPGSSAPNPYALPGSSVKPVAPKR